MFQRPLAYYQSLTGEAKESADVLLKSVGGYDLMQLTLRHPLARENYKLEVAG